MMTPVIKLAFGAIMAPNRILEVIDDWDDDAFDFLRHQIPRIVAVLIIAFILTRLLKLVSRHLGELSNRQDLPSTVRAQQLRTLSSVIYSVGVFVIIFIAAMQLLPLLGINMGPLLGARPTMAGRSADIEHGVATAFQSAGSK